MTSNVEFIEQGHEILEMSDDPVGSIARAARTCYKSEANASPENDVKLVRHLIRMHHDAMLEHAWMSVRFTCDRGISHELVRHRLFSFAQESQRYVNSDRRGFRFVLPVSINGRVDSILRHFMRSSAKVYAMLVSMGVKPQIARYVLPNAAATEIVVTGNMREWRHALKLRTAPDAHPQMVALMTPLLDELKEKAPVLFEDID